MSKKIHRHKKPVSRVQKQKFIMQFMTDFDTNCIGSYETIEQTGRDESAVFKRRALSVHLSTVIDGLLCIYVIKANRDVET